MLSLSMIVRDEAHRLARCLKSVADFVDEMVVVDTGSGDDTAAIAEQCGAVVRHISWPGDFAPARNRALEWTRGDWVLVLDADEQLRPEARKPLRQLMERPEALAITLLRHEIGARQSPYSSVSRLFRRHQAIHWSRPYHSSIDDSVAAILQREPHWEVLQCHEPAIRHDGYRPEELLRGSKALRLRAAMESVLASHPGDPYACAKLGGLELSEGRQQRAVALLRQGLSACPPSDTTTRYELLLHLAMALAHQNPPEAMDLYQQALAQPLDPRLTLTARLNLAALLLRSGQAGAAAALCRRATAIVPDLALAWYDLGVSQRQLGDLPGAIASYRQAIQLAPETPEAHQNLAVAQLLAGDIGAARQGFRNAIGLLEGHGRHADAEDLRQRAGSMVKLEE
jgi:Flp pilus assembly protein TadD